MNKLIIISGLCSLVLFGYIIPLYAHSNTIAASENTSSIKVYLQLDKVAYHQEEDIWFKAYVLHKSSGLLITEDIMVNMALIDQGGNPIVSKSVMITKGLGHGNIFIPDSVKTGKYKFIVFSNQLEHSTLFTKEIQVQNTKSNFGLGSLYFTKSAYSSGDSLTAVYKNFSNHKATNKFKYEIRKNNEVTYEATGNKYLNEDYHIKFKMPNMAIEDQYLLRITSIDQNEEFVSSYKIPLAIDIDLQFFPEGGHLINGLKNKLAFKVIDSNGKPIEVEGELVNLLNGEKISFKSYYQGMGEITFTPVLTDYKVILTKPESIKTPFKLPTIEAIGYTMSVDNYDEDHLTIDLSTTESEEQEIVVAVVAGNKTYWLSEEYIDKNFTLEISKKELPAGIVKIIIFDTENTPILERIAFIHNKSNAEASTDEESYSLREPVSTKIKITNSEGSPLSTNLSLAVIEEQYAENENSSNILSHILLSSELKGTIPTPSFYFNQRSPKALKALDLVMLTNGWRSYSWDAVLNPPKHNEILNFKNKTSISGRVHDANGKKASNKTVQVINKFNWTTEEVTTDETGAFFYETELTSLTKDGFFISVKSNKKLLIELDKQQLGNQVINSTEKLKTTLAPTQSKFENFQFTDNTYETNDARILKEVLIKNKKENYKKVSESTIKNHSLFSTHQVQRISGDKLNHISTSGGAFGDELHIIGWIRQVTSVAYVNKPEAGNVTLRGVPSAQGVFSGGPGPALFIADGQVMGNDYRRLNHIDGNQIESIEVLRSPNAAVIYGTHAAGGVIIINTKQPGFWNPDNETTKSLNPVSVTTRSQNKTFYAPKYEEEPQITDPTPDLRTTLHWEPNIVTDENGEAVISFYSGDMKGNYVGILEGIDINGILTYEKFYFDVK